MTNPEFGVFIRELRRQRTFFDAENSLRQWTQTELGHRANLSPRQIAKIEQGDVADLRPYLDPLAEAFDLSESEKAEFYAIAGYLYSRPEALDLEPDLEALFRQIPFPASARTVLNDFVAFNAYHYVLFGYSPETIAMLHEGELGPNLMRVVFEPRFEYKRYVGGESKWRDDVLSIIQRFRALAFRYVLTDRYKTILREMKHFSAFNKLWDLSAYSVPDLDDDLHRPRPFFTIYHPQFGELQFLSFRRHVNPTTDLVLFMPNSASVDAFQRFRESIHQDTLYRFPPRPLSRSPESSDRP
jgi:transcriptional regulator with XRE-family HTH domain